MLEDSRDIRGKKHKLSDILIMTIYGVLCGYTDFVNIADFLKLHEQYFINLLNLENGFHLMIHSQEYFLQLILRNLQVFLLNELKI